MIGLGLDIPSVAGRGGDRRAFAGFALALDFVNGVYRIGSTVTSTLSELPGYAAAVAPTVTPGTGYVVGGTEQLRFEDSVPAPAGDFTFVAIGLSPTADATTKVLGALGPDNTASRANLTELWRNGSGNCQRVFSQLSSVAILDNTVGTGTPIVTTPAVATGEQIRMGIYREGGVLKPILYGTKRVGTPGHALTTLDTVWIGCRGDAAAPYAGGTIQRFFLAHRVLSDAEIAAL